MKIRFTHILLVLFLLPIFKAGAYTDADCIKCHDRAGQESLLTMSMEQFNGSAHGGEVSCQECHANVVDADHEETTGSGAVDCSACHGEPAAAQPVMPGKPDCRVCHETADDYAAQYAAGMGIPYTAEDVLAAGERIYTLERG